MYAAFDPSFKSRATPADIELNSIDSARATVLRIIGADILAAKPKVIAAPRGSKRKAAHLSSDMIRIEGRDDDLKLVHNL